MWVKRRELYWAQNSRVSWLKEGDRNTNFFHSIASNKRRKNGIDGIDIGGETVKDPAQIKQEASNSSRKSSKKNSQSDPS